MFQSKGADRKVRAFLILLLSSKLGSYNPQMTGTVSGTKSTSSSDTYFPPLLISLHGIRTHGEWQKTFASVVSGTPSKVESFDYGFFGVGKFLLKGCRLKAVENFYKWYHQMIGMDRGVNLDSHDKLPSAVAHSFGTWIIGNALLKFEDIRLDKLILTGSILPRDFKWSTVFGRGQVASVMNEYGKQDYWPRVAGMVNDDMGDSGSRGFDWFNSAVKNVSCEYFDHSDALLRPHIKEHWIPFLCARPSPLALLHGHDIDDSDVFGRLLDHSGEVIDGEVYGNLPNYANVEISRGLSMSWIRANPDIYTFLIDRDTGTPAGYINAMPVEDDLYQSIRSGQVRDNQVPPDSLLPYPESSQTIKIYVMSIAISARYRKLGEGPLDQAFAQLFTGFLEKLIHYSTQYQVKVSHFLATAWTHEGKRLCKWMQMQEVGKDEFGDPVMELDLQALRRREKRQLPPPLRRLLDVYQSIK